jgi:hypothetical protein
MDEEKGQGRVFIPQVPTRYDGILGRRVPTLNLSEARVHGQAVIMTDPEARMETEDLPDALESIKTAMAKFRPLDCILCVGDVVLLAAAITYAIDTHGSVRLLRWLKREKTYEMTEVTL